MLSDLTGALEPLGYTVYDTDVPEQPTFPYIVVWGGESRPHVESPLSDRILGVDDRVGVTIAAGTPEGVRIAHERTRSVLQPGGFPIEVDGFILKLIDHMPVEVDRKEYITGTNRHPAFCVDIYKALK